MPMLERLRDQWNKQFPAHRIPMTVTKKETLWVELRKRMRDQYKCETEYCAVEKLGADNATKFFRPRKPGNWEKNPTEWRANVTQLANPDGSPVDATDAAQLSAAELQGRCACWRRPGCPRGPRP